MIGKTSKKSGIIEGFDRECNSLKKRIKSFHEEADNQAKRALRNEEKNHFNRKTGTTEIDGKTHHLNLKNWRKSANNWKEKKRLIEKGGT